MLLLSCGPHGERWRMTGRLEGRTALVIGAARGIGKGVAQRFVEESAKLVLADMEVERGHMTAKELGAVFVRTDISRLEDAEAAVATALDHHSTLDIMVQNAGIFPWQLIEDTSVEDWDRVMGVNLRGSFNAARAALAPMKRQRSGRMLFTSSITGPHVTSPGHGHYSATKAGINGFIRSAALEFSGYGITVNGVEPGNILTEGVQEQRDAAFIKSMEDAIPLGRLGSPRDVANASCSSLRTKQTTSPARRSSSTAGSFCRKARTSASCRNDTAKAATIAASGRPAC
jgi:3-oxoacyl-[acyl-carrier protein] reductase